MIPRLKLISIAIVFGCIVAEPSRAQDNMFLEAFEEFATAIFWEYEDLPVDWKMKGQLQADFNEGLNNLIENNPALAAASFDAVLQNDSTLWQAYYFRSAARKKLHKLRDAESDVKTALKLHGDFYEGYVELAKIYHLRRKTEESDRAINKAIRLNKSAGTAYYLKGDVHLEKRQVNLAINKYKDCLAADSMFHAARIKLALIDFAAKKNRQHAIGRLNTVLSYDSLEKTALLFRAILSAENDKKQSIRDLTNLIVANPNTLIGYFSRGLLSAELGQYDQAFYDFQKLIKATAASHNAFVGQQTILDKKIDIQNAGAYVVTRVFGLPEGDASKIKEAYCHIVTGQYGKGIAAITQIRDHEKEPVAVYLKAVASEHDGNHRAALEFYQLALQLDDQIGDAYKKLAIYKQELDMWKESAADFTTVLRLNPTAYITHRMRGVSYYYNNEFAKAISDFNVYLSYDSANKEIVGYRGMAYLKNRERIKAYIDFAASENPQALDFKDIQKISDSLLIQKDTAQAVALLKVATGAAPHFTEGYVQKFKIHLSRNEWKPIHEEITRAVRFSRADVLKPVHSYLLTIYALSLSRNRHHEDAMKAFEEAIKFDKNNALAYLERGKVLLTMGKASKAATDFKRASSLGNDEARNMLANLSKK